MQSDDRALAALRALAPSTAAYRAAVVDAREHLRSWLRQPHNGAQAIDAAAALGRFANGRIDVARFSAMFGGAPVLSPLGEAVIGRAVDVLDDLLERGNYLVAHELPEGGDLHALIESALAEAGRAFQSVSVAQMARQGLGATRVEEPLRRFPYRRWNRSERRIAPPIIVQLRGTDLRPGALCEFLDGEQKIVLVVEGPMAAAPLARVITPGLFVAQSDDPATVESLGSFEGPGIVALGGEGAARFVHDPRGASEAGVALRIDFVPDSVDYAVGGTSVAQQMEELAHLTALSTQAAPAAAAADARPSQPSPVDTLASWLLNQAALARPGVPGTGTA